MPGAKIDAVITVLTGDNNFELTQALRQLTQGFDGDVTRADGSEVSYEQLIDLTSSLSLFAEKRMVIIRELSASKSVWQQFGDGLNRVSDDTHVVLVEPSLDKRTATYKRLQKVADVKVFAAWSDRDTGLAERWVVDEAKRQGVQLDSRLASQLVARVGLDQWQLYHALEKLAVLSEVTAQTIEEVIEAHPSENVFNLLEAALRGDSKRVVSMIHTLQAGQDPYMTFGLLSGQVFQLAALAVADKPSAEVAKDIGAHPYALGKLAPYAKKLGRTGSKKIVAIFADTDVAMKSTAADPWLLIEKALVKTVVI